MSESPRGLWPERLVAVLLCSLVLVVVVVVERPTRRPGAPGVLAVGAPFPAGTALRAVEPPAVAGDGPEALDPQIAALVTPFQERWKDIALEPASAKKREIVATFETVFVSAGQYLTFLEILERIQRAASISTRLLEGLPPSAAAMARDYTARLYVFGPFLVWGRLQLGALDAADVLSRELVEAAPDNADAHLVRAVLIDEAAAASGGGGAQELAALRRHLSRVLELDPGYEGFTLDAHTLQRQLQVIDLRLSAPPPSGGAPR